MRVAVIGAGAVGGYYGARLAQAGHDVTLIARGANLEAIRANGFRVRSAAGELAAQVRAESDPSRVGPVDLVLVAVKTYSNRGAFPLVPPLVGPGTAVLSLQNGVDSADELSTFVGPEPMLAGTTYIAATLVEPGVVEHVGTVRRIVFGEAFGERTVTKRVSRIREVLAGADIQAEAAADSRVPIWEKFIFLAPIAALTAAARLPIGPAWTQPAFRETYRPRDGRGRGAGAPRRHPGGLRRPRAEAALPRCQPADDEVVDDGGHHVRPAAGTRGSGGRGGPPRPRRRDSNAGHVHAVRHPGAI